MEFKTPFPNLFDEKEIVNSKEIAQKINSYYQTLFRKQLTKFKIEAKLFLDDEMTPISSNNPIDFCKKGLSKEDLYKAMESMLTILLEMMT